MVVTSVTSRNRNTVEKINYKIDEIVFHLGDILNKQIRYRIEIYFYIY